MESRKLKILLVVDNWSVGGSVHVVNTIFKCINKKAFDVKVLVTKGKKEDFQEGHESLIFIGDVDNKNYTFLEYFKSGFLPSHKSKFNKLIKKTYLEFKPNIIHLHTPLKESLIAFDSENNAVFTFTQHQTIFVKSFFEKIKFAILYSAFMNKVHLISVSKKVEKSILQLRVKPLSNTVIYNGIRKDMYPFIKRDFSSNLLRFIYVARLIDNKGHDILLKAWAKFNYSNKYHLDIIGDGYLKEELVILSNKLGVRSSVTFWGEQINVMQFLSQAHIGVFPSLSEGHPIALLEKMSTGLPVITSDGEEFLEIIQPGVNGFVFAKGNCEDLADKMMQIVEDKNKLEMVSITASEEVTKKFSESLFINNIERYYTQLVK